MRSSVLANRFSIDLSQKFPPQRSESSILEGKIRELFNNSVSSIDVRLLLTKK